MLFRQPAVEWDRQLQQLQQDLAEAAGQKQTMQDRILELEQTQKQNENDQEVTVRREAHGLNDSRNNTFYSLRNFVLISDKSL